MEIDLGVTAAFGLTFVFLAFYFWGRRKNYSIQRKTWESLRSYVKRYVEKVGFKPLGSSAFQISVSGRRSDSFKLLELTVSLLPRDILIHYLISKMRGKQDEIIAKAQFKREPKFILEMSSKQLKNSEKEGKKLKEVDIGKGLTYVKALTSNSYFTSSLIHDPSVRKGLNGLGENLKFLSLSPTEPHLIFVCSISPEIFPHVFSVVEGLGSKISKMSMTYKR